MQRLKMAARGDVPLGIQNQCTMKELLLGLAEAHGVHVQVRELLQDRGQTKLQDWPLSRLLTRSREVSGFSKTEVARRGGPSRTVLLTLEQPTEKNRIRNPLLGTVLALSKGYQIPLALVINAAFLEANLLPAPGALGDNPVRVRKRGIKSGIAV